MTDQTYEPGDSRRVTLKKESGPIEPPRTGPRVEKERDSEKEKNAAAEKD
ncbi:hypothetical protein [Alteriqipengyuania lutimaris]|nr:hypothetical protein [Alteriqipengyuania lutimaris]MBB3034097.1 hypothetical protein [Alteriqipengyuania lutimaris]